MNVDIARKILLIRAIEENDPTQQILSRAARDRATLDARAGGSQANFAEEMLGRRAEILCRQVEAAHPRIATVFRSGRSGWSSWMPIAAVVAVWLFVSAMSKSVWATDNSINILLVPLLVLFVWNVCIVAIHVVFAIRSLASNKPRGHALLDAICGVFGSHRLNSLSRLTERLAAQRGDDFARWQNTLASFAASWAKLVRPLTQSRIRCVLHIGACAIVAGEFLYVYIKGINFEFLVTWESTWLSANATHDVLTVLLWPAWRLLNESIPDANTIAALKLAPQSAAYWIHLYFVQACIIVFVPRCILAAIELRRVRTLERQFPLAIDTDRYYLNLVQADRGNHIIARVLPYSFHPSSKTRDAIRDLLAGDLGYSAHIEMAKPVDYGSVDHVAKVASKNVAGSDDDESSASGRSLRRVLLFNLAQTPEHEVHGQFIAEFLQAASRDDSDHRVAMLVDASGYRERLAGEPEIDSRLEDRQAAWSNLAKEQGIHASFLALNEEKSTPPIEWYPKNG